MARLDIRRLKQVRGITLVVEMQSELLEDIDTVIVAPLVPVSTLPPIKEVNPLVRVANRELAVRLEQLISMPKDRLGEIAGNLVGEEYQIMRALDRLLSRT
jgi:hypothetical protein